MDFAQKGHLKDMFLTNSSTCLGPSPRGVLEEYLRGEVKQRSSLAVPGRAFEEADLNKLEHPTLLKMLKRGFWSNSSC